MAASEPIRSKQNLHDMADYYLRRGQLRNYALIILGAHTALRISDLLRFRWDDLCDFDKGCLRFHITILEKKTGKTKTIALNKQAMKALKLYFYHKPQNPNDFVFSNNRRDKAAISRVQAYRIIRAAADAVGVKGTVSCHSLRKTFGYHAWKSGVPVPLIMDIYNHSSYDVTRRYLGINQDERDIVYMQMELFNA